MKYKKERKEKTRICCILLSLFSEFNYFVKVCVNYQSINGIQRFRFFMELAGTGFLKKRDS